MERFTFNIVNEKDIIRRDINRILDLLLFMLDTSEVDCDYLKVSFDDIRKKVAEL